jgi:toxin ParE1/3/4
VKRRVYRVDWAESAGRDLLGIVNYLAGRNPAAAAEVLERLERRAAALRTAPGRGRVVPELARLQMRHYRELIVTPHRLIYRIDGSRVLVLGVFDSRRNLEDVLLERLIRDA